MLKSCRYLVNLIISILLLGGVFAGAVSVRAWQVEAHTHQLHNAAALCLFAGPTPVAQPNVLAPVPGFCESLLSMTCAPNVTGPGNKHGPCLITDQNVFKDHSMVLYGDQAMFEGMYDEKGKRRSVAEWGEPKEKLLESTWQEDKQLNLFRRVCASLYHPEGTVDRRVIDASTGSEMYAAPFYCQREKLFDAVFGGVQKDFDHWSQKFDLSEAKIVSALDGCHEPTSESRNEPAILGGDVAEPAPAPAPAVAPAPAEVPAAAATNLLREARPHHAGHHTHHKVGHHEHHEVYHFAHHALRGKL